MKHAFLILALTGLFLQSEARVFRGNLLGDQDPDDIAGLPENTVHTHEGDTPHSRANGGTVAQTTAVLQADIANGLRKDFQFIKDTLMQFADKDGFVRDGIIFCGAEADGAQLYRTNVHNDPTGRLSMNDGYGNNVTATADAAVCGSSECEEGSFVSLLTNRVRALGYHVTHSDICVARSEVDLGANVRTCNLKANNVERDSISCPKGTKGPAGSSFAGQDFDQYLVDEKCYQHGEKTTCESPSDGTNDECVWDDIEEFCYGNPVFVKSADTSCKSKASEKIAADNNDDKVSTGAKNAIRRVFAFSIKSPGSVPTTDKAFVSGSTTGCKSLRQYVTALNGMAQINAFRDTGIREAAENWEDVINEARTYIKSYANILEDFYDKSVEMFPLVEYEEIDGCPVGEIEYKAGEEGSVEAPSCELIKYKSAARLNGMSFESQQVLRSSCFCRSNTEEGAGLDEFYLKTAEVTTCNTGPTSVKQFCRKQMMEGAKWLGVINVLQPEDKDIYADSSVKSAIKNQFAQTLPGADAEAIKCGRLVNSVGGTNATYSNKGGNCVPFAKMNDLLYRLEFETSKLDSGAVRSSSGNTYGDLLCNLHNRLANTQFTFRQLAYQWDRARPNNQGLVERPDEDTVVYNGDATTQVHDAPNIANQLFKHGNVKMCSIDWTQEITGEMTRKDSAGGKYTNPYELFDREIGEAIFATEIAKLAKRKTAAANANLWAAIEEELTSTTDRGINHDISYEAAEHFMRIVTTDAQDAAVDSTDDEAVGAATQDPTAIDDQTAP